MDADNYTPEQRAEIESAWEEYKTTIAEPEKKRDAALAEFAAIHEPAMLRYQERYQAALGTSNE